MPADSNAPANRGVERLKRYHLLWCTDHRVPMLTREEDLHEAVVVDLSLEVRDGLRNHVVDLIRVRVRVKLGVGSGLALGLGSGLGLGFESGVGFRLGFRFGFGFGDDLVLVEVLAKHLAHGGHLLASDVPLLCARGRAERVSAAWSALWGGRRGRAQPAPRGPATRL